MCGMEKKGLEDKYKGVKVRLLYLAFTTRTCMLPPEIALLHVPCQDNGVHLPA